MNDEHGLIDDEIIAINYQDRTLEVHFDKDEKNYALINTGDAHWVALRKVGNKIYFLNSTQINHKIEEYNSTREFINIYKINV